MNSVGINSGESLWVLWLRMYAGRGPSVASTATIPMPYAEIAAAAARMRLLNAAKGTTAEVWVAPAAEAA